MIKIHLNKLVNIAIENTKKPPIAIGTRLRTHSNSKTSMKKKTLILIGFIALKFVLQYILISPDYDLQRDEYLHLEQANHRSAIPIAIGIDFEDVFVSL